MMQYRLGDTLVPGPMYSFAKDIAKNGGKVFLVKPEVMAKEHTWSNGQFEDPYEERFCGNCRGLGQVGLQYFNGGPYESPEGKSHMTWYEGRWYKQETKLFTCPICMGEGLKKRERPAPVAVALAL